MMIMVSMSVVLPAEWKGLLIAARGGQNNNVPAVRRVCIWIWIPYHHLPALSKLKRLLTEKKKKEEEIWTQTLKMYVHSDKTMWRLSKDVPKREALEETKPVNILVLNF